MVDVSVAMAFSLDVYRNPADEYTGFLPEEWERIADTELTDPDLAVDGFYAAAYRNPTTGEIVIAFRGWDDPLKDLDDVSDAYNGLYFRQIALAQEFFDRIETLFPSSPISLTGHSLGGALASAIAVRENLTATVFDAIPATDATYLSLQGIINNIDPAHSNSDFTREQVATYSGVTNYSIWGEVANHHVDSTPDDHIGGPPVILLGAAVDAAIKENDSQFSSWDGSYDWVDAFVEKSELKPQDFAFGLHAMGLLGIAQQAGEPFAQAAGQLPRLLLQMINNNLYQNYVDVGGMNSASDILGALTSEDIQAGTSASVLDGFIADVQRLAAMSQEGLGHTDVEINTALIQLAIEYASLQINKRMHGQAADSDGFIGLATGTGVLTADLKGPDGDMLAVAKPIGLDLLSNYLASHVPFLHDTYRSGVGNVERLAVDIAGTGSQTLTGLDDRNDLLIGADGEDQLAGGQEMTCSSAGPQTTFSLAEPAATSSTAAGSTSPLRRTASTRRTIRKKRARTASLSLSAR